MSDNHFLLMALNNAWANETLYKALKRLSTDAFWAPRPGFFRTLGRTMNHIYEVDLYYLDALTRGGKGRQVVERVNTRTAADLAVAQAAADRAFIAFCETLTRWNVENTVPTEREDGVFEERIDRLVLHLVQHQVHHRGQAHVMLSHAGVEPPQLDEFYLDFDRAASAKPWMAQLPEED